MLILDMKKKQIVRLTESDLHRVIKESVKKVLNEKIDTNGQTSMAFYDPEEWEDPYPNEPELDKDDSLAFIQALKKAFNVVENPYTLNKDLEKIYYDICAIFGNYRQDPYKQ